MLTKIQLERMLRSESSLLTNNGRSELNIASVLIILFFKKNNLHVILTKRSGNLRNHAGEISFPGGVFSPEDKFIINTAIRETREEIGIIVPKKLILRKLDEVFTSNSKYKIIPYIALLDRIPNTITSIEVEKVFAPPLLKLFKTIEFYGGYQSESEFLRYIYEGEVIWGATARILHQLSRFIRPC